MPMIKRSSFTYKFKGRPRRGLFWGKHIYKEWFLYGQLSCYKVPEEFGDLSKFTFEEWWRHPDYGFELFCEPEEEEPLLVVDELSKRKGFKYLRIDTNSEPSKLRLMFKTFVKKNVNPNPKVESQARFQPSRPSKRIKMNALKNYRTTYVKREVQGKSRKQVLIDRYGPSVTITDEMLRCVSRDVQKTRMIMKNIQKGTFP